MNPLRTWREANQITQEQLAERLGITQAAVSFMEKNGVSTKRVRLVSQLTGIPVEELLPRLPDTGT